MPLACIERCALLAWDPNYQESAKVAFGSVSNNGPEQNILELFCVGEEGTIQAVGHEPVSSSFSKLIWTSASEVNSLIVGGLNDGSISIWSSHELCEGNPSMQKTVKLYDEPVGGLTNSGFQGNLLVSGSTFGQIHLWDLNKADKQTELLFCNELSGKISDLAWNFKVPHIVAVSSDSGQVSILDLRSKKAVVSFSLPEAGSSVSSISWNPESATGIAVANSADASPHLYLWDLKAPTTTQSTFTGHSMGILSTCWSSSALLSSSRDGAVISWNPENGEFVKEVDKRSDGVFSVSWCPSDSNIFATCAFDGKINLLSYHDALSDQKTSVGEALAEVVPSKSEQGPSPIGAVFGPGSVCSVFRPNRRDVAVVKIVSDDCKAAVNEITSFENLLASTDAGSICKTLVDSVENEKQSWKVVSLLFSQDFNGDLMELIGASNHQYPQTQSLASEQATHSFNKGPFDLHSTNESEIDRSITDKLVAFDVHGAVSDCLSATRFADALILASCYGAELRQEVEQYIFEHSTCSYMRIARALKFHDFVDLIDNLPANEWKPILSLIIHHAQPDKASEFYLRLAERLSTESELFLGAAIAFLLAGDLYKFAERVLFGLARESSSDAGLMDQFPFIFNAYRFIRLLQFYSYGILNTIADEALKSRVLDVILKVKYILYLSNAESAIDSQDFAQFSTQFTGNDVNLDLMIEKLFSSNESSHEESVQPEATWNDQYTQPSYNASHNASDSMNEMYVSQQMQPIQQVYQQSLYQQPQPSYPIQPIQSAPILPMRPVQPALMQPIHQVQSAQLPIQPLQPVQAIQPIQSMKPNPPISPTWSPEGSPKTYNDAPIIKPRGSALVPDVTNQIASMGISDDLDENQINASIQALISTADQKAEGLQKKLVAEWGSRLKATLVCSGNYDPSTKKFVGALFKEIGEYNWVSVTKITEYLLTTQFSETKDWILNVKRLLEIAKY